MIRQEKNKKDYFAFIKVNGKSHFQTIELAIECGDLKKEWWGSNLVLLPIKKEDDGTFSPQWNLFN